MMDRERDGSDFATRFRFKTGHSGGSNPTGRLLEGGYSTPKHSLHIKPPYAEKNSLLHLLMYDTKPATFVPFKGLVKPFHQNKGLFEISNVLQNLLDLHREFLYVPSLDTLLYVF